MEESTGKAKRGLDAGDLVVILIGDNIKSLIDSSEERENRIVVPGYSTDVSEAKEMMMFLLVLHQPQGVTGLQAHLEQLSTNFVSYKMREGMPSVIGHP